MTLSYLASGQTLGGVDIDAVPTKSLLITANDDHKLSANDSPLSPIDTLNLRRRNLQLPSDITPYLSSYTNIAPVLVNLDLSKNGLSDLPWSLEQLTHLCELNLAWNQFTDLPPVLYTLTRLQHLNISGNSLVDLDQLPVALLHLKTLRASDNRLKQLVDRIGLWQDMTFLQLGENGITNLPATLIDMIHLEELDLTNNRLHVWPSSLPTLKHLKLSGNNYTAIPHDLLVMYPKLETLDMSSNQLAFLPCIINCLHSRLRHLNLSDNKIYIVPTSVLTACVHVNLTGNLALEYHRTSTTAYAQKLRDLSKIAVYSTPRNNFHMDISLIELLDHSSPIPPALENDTVENPPVVSTAGSPSRFILNDTCDVFTDNGERWIPSLRELAMRWMMDQKHRRDDLLPSTVFDGLQMELVCDMCGAPCVNEWLSAIQVRAYQAYSSVVCKVTLCSTACWLRHYRKTRKPVAVTPMSTDTPLSRAMASAGSMPALNTLPPDSFEWIVAAATASALQLQEDQSLE